MPRPLDRLISRFLLVIDRLMSRLEAGSLSPADWQATFEQELARYHTAAAAVGEGGKLSERGRRTVERTVAAQLRFLKNFAVTIQDAAEFEKGWRARALLYAQSIKEPYWAGATKFLPLPALPGDGSTQCLGNCKCYWDISTVDAERGDYDCYWRMGEAERHCQTCPQRAAEWAPLHIREGRIQ